MADLKEKVAQGSFANGISFEITKDENPFGEGYLMVKINDVQVASLIINKKKTGTIDVRSIAGTSIKIPANGMTAVDTKSRDLET